MDRAKPQEQLEGGYVWKKLILDDAGKILEQSPAWIYNKYNTLSEMFESKKKGRQAYISDQKNRRNR